MHGDSPGSAAHLTPEELAAYVDGAAIDSLRRRVEEHLADCDECRAEVKATYRSVRETRPSSWKRAIAPVLLAAALIVLVFGATGLRGRFETDPSVLRGSGSQTEGVPGIEPLGPLASALVARDSVRFTWASVEGAGVYSLTVTDELGDVVWRESSSDTVANLPAEVGLNAGRTYFWYVDALRQDGRSATTGIVEFRIKQ